MAKIDFIRTPSSNRRFVDHDLQVADTLYIPVSSNTGVNGNVDEPGPIRINSVTEKMERYSPANGWEAVGQTPFVGRFPTITALQIAFPTGQDGWYAVVTASPHDQEYIWDSDTSAWVLTTNIPASTFAALGGNATDNASLASEFATRDATITGESSARSSADASLQTQINALKLSLVSAPGSNYTLARPNAVELPVLTADAVLT